MEKEKERKKRTVISLVEIISKYPTTAVIDLSLLPAAQLHSIRKELRGSGEVIIRKKSLVVKALRETGKGKLLEFFDGQKGMILSNSDPFSLYKKICGKKLKVYAKPGQIAQKEIIVPAGDTVLSPGPVLSELKQAGIDARVAGGKIVIGKDSVIAKKGDKITSEIAKALQKLDIKPFELVANVPVVLEGETIYTKDVLHIDEAEFMKKLIGAEQAACNLSLEISYPTARNINELIKRAFRNAFTVGVERNIVLPGILEEIIKKAARAATVLSSKLSSQ